MYIFLPRRVVSLSQLVMIDFGTRRSKESSSLLWRFARGSPRKRHWSIVSLPWSGATSYLSNNPVCSEMQGVDASGPSNADDWVSRAEIDARSASACCDESIVYRARIWHYYYYKHLVVRVLRGILQFFCSFKHVSRKSAKVDIVEGCIIGGV